MSHLQGSNSKNKVLCDAASHPRRSDTSLTPLRKLTQHLRRLQSTLEHYEPTPYNLHKLREGYLVNCTSEVSETTQFHIKNILLFLL